jgi:hypothetical protein
MKGVTRSSSKVLQRRRLDPSVDVTAAATDYISNAEELP